MKSHLFYNFSYLEEAFYPVDGYGYGSEGQTDCLSAVHNFGYILPLCTFIYIFIIEINVSGILHFWDNFKHIPN